MKPKNENGDAFDEINRIGPMVRLKIKRIRICTEQKHSMLHYKISFFSGATLVATRLHSFKVIREDEELYLPTHMLKAGDYIWVDQVAFLGDGSFQKMKRKNEMCIPGDAKVLVPIEEIVVAENIVIFKVASINIQATNNHIFSVTRDGNKRALRSDELKAGDMFNANISLLSSGDKVLGSDGEFHSIKKIGSETLIGGIYA